MVMCMAAMDSFLLAWKGLGDHLEHVKAGIEEKEFREGIEQTICLLKEAKSKERRIFLLGVGRDGIILKMFAMRLAQIGFTRGQIKVITEEGPFDLLGSKESLAICMSGRGFTSPTSEIAMAVKDKGASLVLITSNKKCELAKVSDVSLFVDGLTDFEFNLSRHAYGADQQVQFDLVKRQPPPTLFEIASLYILECVISSLHFSQ
jgi:D-arabinose 5-phosphate isomerase GutQ